eukprot:6188439-Pleurochrysis_carterae.AAC.1
MRAEAFTSIQSMLVKIEESRQLLRRVDVVRVCGRRGHPLDLAIDADRVSGLWVCLAHPQHWQQRRETRQLHGEKSLLRPVSICPPSWPPQTRHCMIEKRRDLWSSAPHTARCSAANGVLSAPPLDSPGSLERACGRVANLMVLVPTSWKSGSIKSPADIKYSHMCSTPPGDATR